MTKLSRKLTEIESDKSRVPSDAIREQALQAPPPKNFLEAIQSTEYIGLIAEVKKASPSKGIIREDFDPVSIAQTYANHGASCISVLTDESFFQGDLQYLRDIREAVEIPLLRKDFILDEYQVYQARAAGADAVLLIAECLAPVQLAQLHQVICDLRMTPLVELYDPGNLDAVLNCNPRLVGVNNRDLNTFEVDLNHSLQVKRLLPDNITMVSESGIASPADVRLLHDAGVEAILVGESLMRAQDIGQAVDQLMAH